MKFAIRQRHSKSLVPLYVDAHSSYGSPTVWTPSLELAAMTGYDAASRAFDRGSASAKGNNDSYSVEIVALKEVQVSTTRYEVIDDGEGA